MEPEILKCSSFIYAGFMVRRIYHRINVLLINDMLSKRKCSWPPDIIDHKYVASMRNVQIQAWMKKWLRYQTLDSNENVLILEKGEWDSPLPEEISIISWYK